MELFSYLLKVSACLALFFSFYLLVLRKLTFFKINRFYLLFTLVLSFVIPNLQFTIERAAPVEEFYVEPVPTVTDQHQTFEAPLQINTIVADESFDWYSLLPFAYGLIVLILLGITAWRLLKLYQHTRTKVEEINGLKIVAKNSGFTNCSFFNYVFIDQHNLTETELAVLLRHEEVHATQYHSIDKLILMFAKAVLWFNPLVYLYDKALEQAHEYEADETTSQSFGTSAYASLLLSLAVSKSEVPLVHNFVKSPIKQRIKMLFNSKSKNMKKLMYLLALPIGLCLVWLFATEVVYAQVKNEQKVTQNVPFIKRAIVNENGQKMETIVVTVRNKTVSKMFSTTPGKSRLMLYINGKIYTEAEALKFKPEFIAQLSNKNGTGSDNQYQLPGLGTDNKGFVVWFGAEPPLSAYAAKNKAYYQKYNGTTVEGKVLNYTYSPNSKVIDGFLVKTNQGEILRANVEAKFANYTQEIINVDDEVTIKIYNANYQKDSEYPVLVSYKISKGGKLLYDKWPKISVTKSMTNNTVRGVTKPIALQPELISSSTLRVDVKNNISYITKGRLQMNVGVLEAEDIVWDQTKQTLDAKEAKFKGPKGVIMASLMKFDLNHATCQLINAKGETLRLKGTDLNLKKEIKMNDNAGASNLYKLINNLSYTAKDSIITKKDGSIILNGVAKINIDGSSLTGKQIRLNKHSNLISADEATLSNEQGAVASGKRIVLDVATKKYDVIN